MTEYTGVCAGEGAEDHPEEYCFEVNENDRPRDVLMDKAREDGMDEPFVLEGPDRIPNTTTVDELREELKEISDKGHGDATVHATCDGWLPPEINVELDEERDTVVLNGCRNAELEGK